MYICFILKLYALPTKQENTLKLSKADKTLLAFVEAGSKSTGYAFVDPTAVQTLVDAKLIEVNSEVIDSSNGFVAARIPLDAVKPESQPEPVQPAVDFVIEDGIPVPVSRRGSKASETYPFSKLEVGQSIFVALDVKKLRNTITYAERRFAVASETETVLNRKKETVAKLIPTKRFKAFAVTAGQKYSNGFEEKSDGSRIFRTA